jgi:hypothetical protein
MNDKEILDNELRVDKYYEGQGCTCFAWSGIECGCIDVDWTPKEVYTLRNRIKYLELKQEKIIKSIKKCFGRAVACDNTLLVNADNYDLLVKVCNKVYKS